MVNWEDIHQNFDRKDYYSGKTYQQLWEEYNQTLPEEVKFPKYKIHKRAIYTSQLLPTKEITQLLQNSQLSNKSSQSYQDSGQINLETPTNLNQLNLSEENQQSEQTSQILHQTHGTPGSSKNPK